MRKPLRVAALAGTLVAGLVLAGCAGPHQAGSAAVIGDSAISLDTVQARIDSVLAHEPAAREAQHKRKLDRVSRQILTLSVRHRLITRIARHEHLRADQATVEGLLERAGGARQAAQGTVLDAAGMRQRFTDKVLLAEFARSRMPTLAVTFDYALVRGPGKAERLAHRMAEHPNRAGTMIRSVRRGGGAGAVDKHVSARSQPRTAAATPLFGLPEHTVAAFPAGGSSARWLVVLVERRTATPADPAQQATGKPGARTRLLSRIGERLLGPHAASAGVRVSPRYGMWDPIGMRVAASADVATGVVLPVDLPASGTGAR